ncbi:MAG: LysR substrate-binding domain-containing protein, partial [Betaproteobacteria bacterium]
RIEVVVQGPLVLTGGDAVREAALLGLGVVQSNWWTVGQDLAQGRLVELLKPYAVEGQPISVVYPPTRHVPTKLRVMIDYLVEITRVPGAEASPFARL